MSEPQEQDDEVELIPASATALEQITRGEVDMQIATAKRYPRSVKRFMQSALSMATIDQDTAQSCYYSLRRKDKDGRQVFIEGPSVRLAEIACSAWGNIAAEARVIGEDEKNIIAQGSAWDLERNVRTRMEVKRRIVGRNGNRYSDDMVVLTGNAAAAIAYRNAVLKVIPRAYVDQLTKQCKAVAAGSAKTLAETWQATCGWFQKIGVDEAQLLAFVERAAREDVTLEDVATLKGVATAIKDGTVDVDSQFGTKPPPDGTTKVADIGKPVFGFPAKDETKS